MVDAPRGKIKSFAVSVDTAVAITLVSVATIRFPVDACPAVPISENVMLTVIST